MPNSKRIFLVDDDEMLRKSLAEQFAISGFEPVSVASASEAWVQGLDGLYEFMILDISLPDGDGRELCREFRNKGVTCPILILTASDSDEDTIAGCKAGANDYIQKPFRFAVLMARVEAHLRSHETSKDAIYRIGPYIFRPSAKLLLEGDKRIRLTEKETNILKFLQRAGDTVSRDVLLHEVWGYNPAVTTHTLETHIYRLRQKIERDTAHAKILITESGGYRLMG
jgi:DNA-binding response OmpR family regulator